MTPLLSIDATLEFRGAPKPVLDGLRLDIGQGEILGLLGRSGSGKSSLALAILGLLPRRRAAVKGEILFRGRDLLALNEKQLRAIRGKEIALVLQAAAAALHPGLTLETQFREAWRAHSSRRWDEQEGDVYLRLQALDLDCSRAFLQRYPSQISVGQSQRVLIALASLHQPALMILDEPTSALDTLARAEVLRMMRRLNESTGASILYISHDLSAVASVCDRIAVLHGGTVVETGTPAQIFTSPRHALTRALAVAAGEPIPGAA